MSYQTNYPTGFTQAMHDAMFRSTDSPWCDECGEPGATIAYERPLGKRATETINRCERCAPKCHCGKPIHPESEGCCAGCEVKFWAGELRDHQMNPPNPMTNEYAPAGGEIQMQLKLWRIREAA